MQHSIFESPVTACVLAAAALMVPPASARSSNDLDGRLFPSRVLAAHNAARAAAGVAPLQWDSKLGNEAASYAVQLALSNRFAHSTPAARNNAGENLWMGTRGAFSVHTMVANWASERTYFRPGVFPNVSRTGNWADVGHYTQIVWPTTQRVGCALATNAAADYLVCRYWPSGNVRGVPIHNTAARLARR